MKFLTSPDIRVANQTRFALLDIRIRKQPKLTEIFKADNPVKPQRLGYETIPVFELEVTNGQQLKEQHFAGLVGYQLVVVLTNSLQNYQI